MSGSAFRWVCACKCLGLCSGGCRCVSVCSNGCVCVCVRAHACMRACVCVCVMYICVLVCGLMGVSVLVYM